MPIIKTNTQAGMKSLISILVIVLMSLPQAFAGNKHSLVKTASIKHKNQFVLTVDKDFIGGHIVVLSADGHQVTSQRLLKRKMVIDFFDVKAGVYTILLKNEDEILEYEFVKK